MEKQDAIDFIVEAFDQGKSPSEIARDLSHEMKAPYNIVAGFVNRTLEQRMAQVGSLPPASVPPPSPPVVEPPPAVEPPQAASGYDWNAPTPGWTPPGTGWEYTEEALEASSSAPEASGEQIPEQEMPADEWEIPLPDFSGDEEDGPEDLAATLGAAAEEAVPGDLSRAAEPMPLPAAAPASASGGVSREIDPQLEKFILSQLGSDKKHSDIVLAVCERTGMSWPDAQRLVGRVGAMNRKKVASRRNIILIPMAVIAMLAGLALIVSGVLEFAAYRAVWQGLIEEGAQGVVDAGIPQNAYRPDILAGYILLGLGLLVGGSVGLIQSLRAQAE